MIWVLGGRGLLGSDVGRRLGERGLAWVGTGREVDLADEAALEAFAAGRELSAVVNCAAYTAVDRAEDEPDLCRRLNAEGPAVLARWCRRRGLPMVHLSTDYVFSGDSRQPYREDDQVGPTGVYGATKAEGEALVRSLCPRHYILRTSWLYGQSGPNFVYTMLRLMSSKEQLGVVADQTGCPTWSRDLADVIVRLLEHRGPWGTYHASGEGQATWFDFAEAIRDAARARQLLTDRAFTLNALTTAQYPTRARRPAWSVLSKEKLAQAFGLRFPPWRESLVQFLGGPLEASRYH